MQTIRHISRAIIDCYRQVWHLPRFFALARQQRRQEAVRKVNEAERLDRIRNPNKYLGK